jgi:phosphopantetheinyl transferase
LETLSRSVDHEAVSAHYFTSGEQAKIAESGSARHTFLDYWTRKEAVLKASGVGIMDDLRTLSVDDEVNHLTIQHADLIAMAAENYFVRTWHVGEQHIISLATPVRVGRVLLVGA